MYRLRQRLVDYGMLWVLRRNEIARFQGIILADLCSSPNFKKTILAALELIQKHDPRRFARIQRYITWIVNRVMEQPGGQYQRTLRICMVDFEEPSADSDPAFDVAWWARMIVHEATHGLVDHYGIKYTPQLRTRIERLCVVEENRFVRKFSASHPELAQRLYQDFDESKWNFSWTASPTQKFSSNMRRIRSRFKEGDSDSE